jgi:hypothetical protein
MKAYTVPTTRKTSAALSFALLILAALVCGRDAKATPQDSIWNSGALPANLDSGGGPGVELGVKFRSDVSGTITSLRFYKNAANTGTHVGNLWSSTGTLLASATFANETASGWQQVTFSPAVPVTANTVYVASYHTNVGHFSYDLNAFASAGVDNTPLHALQNGVSGGNGVYAYNATSSFPMNSYYSANYWVDVVFTPQQQVCPCTIWGSNAVPSSADNGPDSPVEVGVKFTSSSNGTITGVRFYKSNANTGTHVGNLWSSTGALLASATFTNETGSGWQQVNFSSPVAIAANTTYVASYHATVGHYSADLGFFSTSGANNPPLQALASSMNGGNGVYMYGSNSSFPNNTYDGANYWVDVVFSATTASPPATIAPTITTQPISQTVIAGQSATFSTANAGTAPLGYQWQKNGSPISGATSSSYTTPPAATSDNGSQFTVVVSNPAGSVVSNAAVLTVKLPSLILNTSTTSLSFGSVNVSNSTSQTVTLTNAGNGNVAISSISVSGAGFNASGVSSGTVLTPGQSATLGATFAPAASGNVTGSITVGSNATGGPVVIALAGTGVAPVAHAVMLSWAPSTSTVVGYNVYESTVSGSSYTKLTASPVPAMSYSDGGLETAQTRYYVVTSVDSNNNESAMSNQVAAIVP